MNGICELNFDELEMVSGGGIAGYKECPGGSTGGGGPGLYPDYVPCATATIAEGVAAFVQGFKDGGGTFPGGGGGSGSGSGSGGYPA
jgi:hypothetical protein